MQPDTATPVKGKVTFRIAAVLFALSALFELIGIASGVPLFGTFRGGFTGAAYHLVFAGLYFALGVGLWQGTGWGYRLVFATTLLYTLDRFQYLLYRKAMLTQISDSLRAYRTLLQAVDPQMLLNVMTLVTLLFVACWWGFAGYTYARRAYFKAADVGKNRA